MPFIIVDTLATTCGGMTVSFLLVTTRLNRDSGSGAILIGTARSLQDRTIRCLRAMSITAPSGASTSSPSRTLADH